ncbi:MAG: carboxylating nicotinate-nucleotide diphosphorylase [Actinobacteria bacterium]|nr:carboxylating nicotinate-nucleotide diphosphorylase [Actinomycetota bacterium]NDE53535.1 carboxylating nicotinate-nucleotide diphosphorylase [Actinomycetota bacterium]
MISPSLGKKIEAAGLDLALVEQRVAQALAEDAHAGDLTSKATIGENHRSTATFNARKTGTIAGTLVAAAVLEECGLNNYEIKVNDGTSVEAGTTLITVEGNTRAILLAERTALNFLSHLSGIASLTSSWVKEVAGTKAKVRDTRKTTPSMRELEKYAVRMGGGANHRMTLSDGALIKDNHIAAAGSVTDAINRVKREFPGVEIEVEVDNLEQLKEALHVGVDIVLLDNMSIEETKAAVELAKHSPTKLESSGGLTLENANAYASTGVDYLAVGALTHSAPVLDIGLDF